MGTDPLSTVMHAKRQGLFVLIKENYFGQALSQTLRI